MRILVLNAGSSSLKVSLLDDGDAVVLSEELPPPGSDGAGGIIGPLIERASPVDVVAHRVVHGGLSFRRAVLVDETTSEELADLSDLAPLHNPPALAGIAWLLANRPAIPQVACFDTTFHVDLPPEATTYAVPRHWIERWGIRRFGFHGLSHAWASRRAAELLGQPLGELRLVTAHIGSGASLAAVSGGRSVDTTMGFTPLEGLVMATRSGSIDPGLILWVLRHGPMTADELEDALERRSGLLALAGESDLREVIRKADAGEERALVAYGVYTLRLRQHIAAMAAAMLGLDGLVFTGGAGSGSARLRYDTCEALGFLGIGLDGAANDEEASDDRIVSSADAAVKVVVVQAREDLEIARQVRELLD